MTQDYSVPWTEVKEAAEKVFDVWRDGSELEWAEQAWYSLAGAGLTLYSNEWERCQVLVQLLAMGTMYRTFCDVGWDERWDWEDGDYESWSTALVLDSFRIGWLVGRDFFLDENMNVGLEGLELLNRGILTLVDQAIPRVFIALKKGFGGEAELYESLCQTNSHHEDDWDGVGPEPRLYNAPSSPMALFVWVSEGCKRLR